MLPQELTESCIDWLEKSQTSLKSCSLVCRCWLPRARFHIFRRLCLELRFREPLRQLIDRIRVDLLTNSAIVSCVRELSLNLRYQTSLVGGSQSPPQYEILAKIPFTGLQHLHVNLACSFLTESEHSSGLSGLLILLRNNPHLEHLSLQTFGVDAQSLHEIFLTLSIHTPRIKTLILDDVFEFVHNIGLKNGPWPTLPHLLSLEKLLIFEGRGACGLMGFIFRSRGIFNWETIGSLALIGHINEDGVQALVESDCDHNVSCLTVDLRNLHLDSLRTALFENFPNLIELQLLPPSSDTRGLLLHTLHHLEQMKSLTRLMSLHISNPALISHLDTQLLKLTVATPSLRHISLNFRSWSRFVVESMELENYLPLTSKTGVLQLGTNC